MARRLLERALPADAREHVVADMDELFKQRLERDGAWRARSWFFLQAITFWVRFWFVRRTSTRVAFSLLDWKLGARMLLKHPGISLVGGLALATVIAVGAGFFHMARIHFDPDLKLAEHERIVRLDRFDVGGQDQWPVTMPEVLAWRGALTEVVELSAYRTVERNLIATLGESETAVDVPVVVAEITPSAFLLTRLPPARGRGLTEADAHPDALPVVVLEWGLWQKRLGADPGIVGQEVRLGRETYTVVGVMPEGFVFPRYHEAWIPLPAERDVPGWVQAFGRLAPGATLESAQAELSAVATRTFADVASDDERYTGVPADLMQARVIGYADPDPASGDALGIIMASFMVLLALVAVAANVATLVFARTAMRESEIVVRTALGASRARVVAQLFVESLVLALVAAGVGLVGLNVVLEVLARPDTERLPYWTRAPLDLPTLLFSVGFAALGAGLVALLPALKSTGAGVQERLRSMGAGGTSLRFGGVWSVIIVMQVAITVACLPFGVDAAHGTLVELGQQSQFHAESYLSFRLEVDPDASGVGPDAAQNDRYRMQMANSYTQLERSLSAEATVADVTFGDALPGMGRPWALYEPNQAAADSAAGRNWSAQYSSVATDYFEVFGAPIVAGRGFNEGDIGAANRPVIVNEAFARTLGGNVIGSLLRLAAPEGAEPGDWYEIVGVVGNVGHRCDAGWSVGARRLPPGDRSRRVSAGSRHQDTRGPGRRGHPTARARRGDRPRHPPLQRAGARRADPRQQPVGHRLLSHDGGDHPHLHAALRGRSVRVDGGRGRAAQPGDRDPPGPGREPQERAERALRPRGQADRGGDRAGLADDRRAEHHHRRPDGHAADPDRVRRRGHGAGGADRLCGSCPASAALAAHRGFAGGMRGQMRCDWRSLAAIAACSRRCHPGAGPINVFDFIERVGR